MPVVNIKGVGDARFPDGMSVEDIRAFLRRKYAQDAGATDVLAPMPNTAQPYQQTLPEKMGQGLSDALFDSGVVSDRYWAQKAGSTLSSIGEMLPVIGDAAAGDEFGRASAKGDISGMALAGIGAIPVVGKAAKKAIEKLPVKITMFPRGNSINIESENGRIMGGIEGGDFVIGGASIKDPSKRGKGEGKGLYLAAIDEAKKRNLKKLVSDESVTPDAARVWESLKKDGFPVVKHKDARFIDDKQGGFWGVDGDLPVYTMSIK